MFVNHPRPINLKLIQYCIQFYIYILYSNFAVVGILKMGWKKLYLRNKNGTSSETLVYCLLDFYIHESKQRQGYGKRLIEYMLQVT